MCNASKLVCNYELQKKVYFCPSMLMHIKPFCSEVFKYYFSNYLIDKSYSLKCLSNERQNHIKVKCFHSIQINFLKIDFPIRCSSNGALYTMYKWYMPWSCTSSLTLATSFESSCSYWFSNRCKSYFQFKIIQYYPCSNLLAGQCLTFIVVQIILMKL